MLVMRIVVVETVIEFRVIFMPANTIIVCSRRSLVDGYLLVVG